MSQAISRILVIGGGPAGLVTLRNLLDRGQFDHVELYERRDDIGGVWYYDEPQDSNKPRWPSPAYKGLIGNVLPEFLGFSGHPFPEPPSSPHQPFPTLKETYDYLRLFAEPFLKDGKIKLNRQVVRVQEIGLGGGWQVVSRDWNHAGREMEEQWDAVVVAVGWWDNLVWPQTEGLDALRERGLAKHANSWRGPEGYEGKKALVVGNANSANDIAAQLAPVVHAPLYQSIRRPPFAKFVSLENERIVKVSPVAKYILKEDDKFDALLTDGTLLADLDTVQLGTGYRPFPSFVHVFEQGVEGKLVSIVSDSTYPPRIPSLHRMVLYAYNPSLAFLGAPLPHTPFPIADLMSTWLALAWRGEVPYPDTPEGRLVFEKERLEAVERVRQTVADPSSLIVYSVLGPYEQEFAAGLRVDIVKARPELDSVLPVWNDERTAVREAMYQIKYQSLEYARDHPGPVVENN